jgi:hypothetical protein
MNSSIEFRKSKRFDCKITAILENEPSGYFSYAQMMNYGNVW